jgi:tetratricopeptide (TPR) repeat protein
MEDVREKVKTMKVDRLIAALTLLWVILAGTTVMAQTEDPVAATKTALKNKNFKSMLTCAEKVIEDYPDWFWGHHWKGRALYGLNDYGPAVAAFKLSLDSAEKDDEVFLSKYFIVDSYYRNKDYQNCIKAVDSALLTQKSKYFKAKYTSLLSRKGYSHKNLMQYEDAVKCFKPLLDSGKASEKLYKAVALCYVELGQNTKAVKAIEASLKKNPKDLAAQKILVKSLTNEKQWQRAFSSANAALKYYQNDWELNFLAGQACYHNADWKNARTYLEKSYRIKHHPKTAYCLARTYNSLQNWPDAVKYFNGAKQKYSEHADFNFNFAYAYLKYVPEDAEKYHQRPEGKEYLDALASAELLLNNAAKLKGVDQKKIVEMTAMLTNKRDRLEKGETITEVYEWVLNPETGKWEKQAKVK